MRHLVHSMAQSRIVISFICLFLALLVGACATNSTPRVCSYETIRAALGPTMPNQGDHYLENALVPSRRLLGFMTLVRVGRWSPRKFPLRVQIERLPSEVRSARAEVEELIRAAIREWSDVVEPGLPSFRFKQISAAEIRFKWTRDLPEHIAGQLEYFTAPGGFQFRADAIQLPVEAISDSATTRERLYRVVLHELGHALGIIGHSDDPSDIMFQSIVDTEAELTGRDRNTLRMLYSCPTDSVWKPVLALGVPPEPVKKGRGH